jgi:hypothetical protein
MRTRQIKQYKLRGEVGQGGTSKQRRSVGAIGFAEPAMRARDKLAMQMGEQTHRSSQQLKYSYNQRPYFSLKVVWDHALLMQTLHNICLFMATFY